MKNTTKQGLTQAALADRIGCIRQNVQRAVRDGLLVKNADGRIDPDHPSNVEWIASRRGMRDKTDPVCTSPANTAPADCELDRAALERRKLEEQIRTMEQKRDIQRGKYVSRELTSRVLAKFFAIDTSEWLYLPTKMATEAGAIFGSDDAAKVQALRTYGETEAWKIIAHCKRLFNDFLDSIKAEPIA